jgi:hypothetical protein
MRSTETSETTHATRQPHFAFDPNPQSHLRANLTTSTAPLFRTLNLKLWGLPYTEATYRDVQMKQLTDSQHTGMYFVHSLITFK